MSLVVGSVCSVEDAAFGKRDENAADVCLSVAAVPADDIGYLESTLIAQPGYERQRSRVEVHAGVTVVEPQSGVVVHDAHWSVVGDHQLVIGTYGGAEIGCWAAWGCGRGYMFRPGWIEICWGQRVDDGLQFGDAVCQESGDWLWQLI